VYTPPQRERVRMVVSGLLINRKEWFSSFATFVIHFKITQCEISCSKEKNNQKFASHGEGKSLRLHKQKKIK
jgi:hypothetical protein